MAQRLTDDYPIVLGPMLTTYGEIRMHANNIRRDPATTVEEGLATTILILLDELEAAAQRGANDA